MKQYLDLVQHVLDNGAYSGDRTGTGTYSVFGYQVRYPAKPFPILTTKSVSFKNIAGEALWFLTGKTNVEQLRALTHGPDSTKRTIWDDNYENQGRALGYNGGELGPVYGKQWRCFGGRDQLFDVIEKLKNNPRDRRMVVSAWNPGELDYMALPPCHLLFQFYSINNVLSIQWYQRSQDVFLGKPYNLSSYALILNIVAKMVGMEVGEVICSSGDTHIYSNHVEQCKEQLSREPRALPTLVMPEFPTGTTEDQLKFLETLTANDFKLVGYNPHPAIKAKMAI